MGRVIHQGGSHDVSKCFVTRLESTVCHLEVVESPGLVKATPWVQDRQLVRPVLNTSGQHPEFLAHDAGAALSAVVGFLETRLGLRAEPPRPCPAEEHLRVRGLPLAWTEALPLGADQGR